MTVNEYAVPLVREHHCPICKMTLYLSDPVLGEYCCRAHKMQGEKAMRVIPRGHTLKQCAVCLKEYDAGPPSRAGRRQTCSVACQRKAQSMDMRMMK